MTAPAVEESLDKIEHILRAETVGYLGLAREGLPYVVPLNYVYTEGKILFHCALAGKKIDFLKANPTVCFAVGQLLGPVERHAEDNPCHIDNYSVICYGAARLIEDLPERQQALEFFNRRFDPHGAPISLEASAKCYAVEITLTEATGRQQLAGKRAHWQYRFER